MRDRVCDECAAPPSAYHRETCSQFLGYRCNYCGVTYRPGQHGSLPGGFCPEWLKDNPEIAALIEEKHP